VGGCGAGRAHTDWMRGVWVGCGGGGRFVEVFEPAGQGNAEHLAFPCRDEYASG
jgi:hypothetical protein